MKLVRIHKEFNRSAIPFYREKAMDFFSEIMKKWNQMQEYEPLVYNTNELKKTLNIDIKNHNYFNEFVLQFAKDTTTQFTVGGEIITGNAFTFVENIKNKTFTVELNSKLIQYVFTKSDIELMKKNKRKQRLTTDEMEKYNQNKSKYQQLMLFSQTELFNFNSKYAKRLYMLLIQFTNTGKFIMNYSKFKEVMEIPKSYNQGHIDIQIFQKSKEELEGKTPDIRNIEFNKIKKGRSIDRIEITFGANNDRFKNPEIEEESKSINDSQPKIDFDTLTEKEKEYLQKAQLIAKGVEQR